MCIALACTRRQQLAGVFNEVREVEALDSQDAAHLALLGRPDLGATFTKLRIWTLTHYSKAVYLDADTLVRLDSLSRSAFTHS